MLSEFQDVQIREEIYRGTLSLLLQQGVNLYKQALSLGISLDIQDILRGKLRRIGVIVDKHDQIFGKSERQCIVDIPSVVRVEKSVKIQEVRGRWTKNRNDGYKKKKMAKNTQKKIQKAKRKKNENKS